METPVEVGACFPEAGAADRVGKFFGASPVGDVNELEVCVRAACLVQGGIQVGGMTQQVAAGLFPGGDELFGVGSGHFEDID